jgi:hypothetical protein
MLERQTKQASKLHNTWLHTQALYLIWRYPSTPHEPRPIPHLIPSWWLQLTKTSNNSKSPFCKGVGTCRGSTQLKTMFSMFELHKIYRGQLPSIGQLQHPFLQVWVLTEAQRSATLTQHAGESSIELHFPISIDLLQRTLTWLQSLRQPKVAGRRPRLNSAKIELVSIKTAWRRQQARRRDAYPIAKKEKRLHLALVSSVQVAPQVGGVCCGNDLTAQLTFRLPLAVV